jgi:O-antigen/teichoic acid export membrane protein
MRFFNSLRNSALAFIGQIITILMGFGVRWLFIHKLGQDYLGVNSVMESMLMILSMTELGIGTSVAFALYKPIANGDERRIGSLMAFYRKVYHAIGIFTAVIGPFLLPFMHFFTKEAVDVGNLNLIYLLFLLNTVLSYFFAYKRTLLNAYQQSYVNSVSEDLFAVLKYILQALVLIYYKSYIGFIVINIVCAVLTNIVISIVCDKKYPFVKNYKKEKLTTEDRNGIRKSIVSLMYQKIGAKLVTGTDNLMISYAKLSLMGIYSNYAMVVSIVSRVVYNVLHSVMGSMGNLMVQKDSNHKNNVFEEFAFATFGFYFFIAIGFSACLERFIVLWAGEDWLLSPLVTLLVIFNFFLMGMRQPCIVVI